MVTGGNATVFITDMNASLAFYTDVLGMTVKSHYGDHWAEVSAGGFDIGLHPKRDEGPAPGQLGSIIVGLIATDLGAARPRLLEGGAKDVAEVVQGDGGSFLHFHDPDGNALYLWQLPKH
jgi:catechol 2,3-dioxygenase-like lactoylglutathione lyase family enzyme